MENRFNRSERDEPLSRILLYSVIAHYVVFYFLFGNPFLILLNRGGGGGTGQNLDIELFSLNQVNIASSGNPVEAKRDFPAFPPEEGAEGDEEPPVPEKADPAALSEEGIKAVEAVEPLPPPPPKRVARKVPRHMTGPEDCMLKVVAMVCPNGDAQCITEYREFCTSLPD